MPEVMIAVAGMWVLVSILLLAMCRAATVGDEMMGGASEGRASGARDPLDRGSEPRSTSHAISDERAAHEPDAVRVPEAHAERTGMAGTRS